MQSEAQTVVVHGLVDLGQRTVVAATTSASAIAGALHHLPNRFLVVSTTFVKPLPRFVLYDHHSNTLVGSHITGAPIRD